MYTYPELLNMYAEGFIDESLFEDEGFLRWKAAYEQFIDMCFGFARERVNNAMSNGRRIREVREGGDSRNDREI